jgi:c-di-GMP-binding flagellar brake protein YcgR
MMETLDAILSARDVVAVLRRDLPVRLLDISASGCLLQSETRLAEGTTGTLRLLFDAVEYVDDVRIMRCQAPNSGDSWFRLGAEFLWTSNPDERSLRRVVAGLQPEALKAAQLGASRQV